MENFKKALIRVLCVFAEFTMTIAYLLFGWNILALYMTILYKRNCKEERIDVGFGEAVRAMVMYIAIYPILLKTRIGICKASLEPKWSDYKERHEKLRNELAQKLEEVAEHYI